MPLPMTRKSRVNGHRTVTLTPGAMTLTRGPTLTSIDSRLQLNRHSSPFTCWRNRGEDPRRRSSASPTRTTPTRSRSRPGKIETTGLEWKPNPFDEYALETALRLTENGANTEGAPGRGRRRHVRPEGDRDDAPRRARDRRRPRDPRRRDRRHSSTATSSRARSRRSSRRRSRTSSSSASRRSTATRTRSGRSSPSTSAGRRRRSPGTIKSEDDKALLVGREVDGGVASSCGDAPGGRHGRPPHRRAEERLVEAHARHAQVRRRRPLRRAPGDHGREEEAARRDEARRPRRRRGAQDHVRELRAARRRARPASR